MSLKQTFWCNNRFISLLSPKHVSTKIVKEHLILSKTLSKECKKLREGEHYKKKKKIFGDQFTANKIYLTLLIHINTSN